MKKLIVTFVVCLLVAGCQSAGKPTHQSIEAFRHWQTTAPLTFHTPFAPEVCFLVELIEAYRRDKSWLPETVGQLIEFSRSRDISVRAITFLEKNVAATVTSHGVRWSCWDFGTREHWVTAWPTGEFRITGEVYGSGTRKGHIIERDGYSSHEFISETAKVSKLPNKAPEPTPGSVTPRATEGTSKRRI